MDIFDFSPLIIGIVIICFLGFISQEITHNNEKEIEMIKNTQNYEIYDNCHKLDESWYCYNEK